MGIPHEWRTASGGHTWKYWSSVLEPMFKFTLGVEARRECWPMRALLVQSAATSPWIPRRQWEPPSVAMATIAGQIDNHDVRVADMSIWRKQAPRRFLEALKEFNPEIVGFTAMTFQYQSALEFAWLAKQFNPKIRTALGGYHATLFCDELATGPDAPLWDFIFRGEGDFSFGELPTASTAAEKALMPSSACRTKRETASATTAPGR